MSYMARPSSSTSRNDLFSASWVPDVPPPKALHQDILPAAPRSSSFFDASPADPPLSRSSRPRIASSALSLSRASSIRARPPNLQLDRGAPSDTGPLSPLHQSPSLTSEFPTWQPPLPPSADDVQLRFAPSNKYLLGEGRYARVYLASYRHDAKGKGRERPLALAAEVNGEADGLVGGSWRLCAAKRLAGDRESQIMGLREAFFLNRLAKTPVTTRRSGVSPFWEKATRQDEHAGSVYIVKLIAVKEDNEPARRTAHSRSSSDALSGDIKAIERNLNRQRSSTLDHPPEDDHTLGSFPSLPALGNAARAESAPSLSRLVLLLEHAPLGTLDRLLRTSPNLVGRDLWARWAIQSTEALAWVHSKGVVHADVKPGNFLLTSNLELRLSDFGSSLLIHPSHPPTDGVGLGTLPFSPPELVDPGKAFSFPVDIFALGATLYQCITGREPFRGLRGVEMMHHVRKGGLWSYEERVRLDRIGSTGDSVAGSPYPSAWRDPADPGLKRAGSLRVPLVTASSRPRLHRMSSAESLRASEDLVDGPNNADSPAGIRLWAHWVKQPLRLDGDAIALLLSEKEQLPLEPLSRRPSSRSTAAPSRQSSISISPTSPHGDTGRGQAAYDPPYKDGSPEMLYLDGQQKVAQDVRELLCSMLNPDEELRPTAECLRDVWREVLGNAE